MLAGSLRIDITPPIGTPIGGNVRSDNVSRGIHDPLYANLLYLENEGSAILFINLDIIGIHRNGVNKIKKEIEKKTGLKPEAVVITATHTHSGPDIMEALKEEYDSSVIQFLKGLTDQLGTAARHVIEHTFSANLRIGRSVEDSISFNRRLVMSDGSLIMNWERPDPQMVIGTTGPIDPELLLLKITDENNNIRALLVNFTLHPAILVGLDWQFSRDFVHDLNEGIHENLGKDVVVLFFNGALGNVNHLNVYNPNQERGFGETKRVGRKLAAAALDALEKAVPSKEHEIQFQLRTVALERRKITDQMKESAKELLEKCGGVIPSLLDGVPDEAYAREIIIMAEENLTQIETELQVIRIGEIVIACLPGEFFVEFGLQLKQSSPFSFTMVFGLANDYVGYVPTLDAFTEGGYEIKTSRHSQLVPEAGNNVIKILKEMIDQIRR